VDKKIFGIETRDYRIGGSKMMQDAKAGERTIKKIRNDQSKLRKEMLRPLFEGGEG
jgi:hypothetical protein